jgi:uncharacterized protein (TIGR04255 family)
MAQTTPKFHYPAGFPLETNPLVEAWLTIHWPIEQIQAQPPVGRDPGFDFNFVTRFFKKVESDYGDLHELDIVKSAPLDLAPHQPRYQFRSVGESIWPMLQLGPGVATVNFTKPYTWSLFKEQALFLREALLSTRQENNLAIKLISLRYRNAIPYEYSSGSLFRFLSGSLNTAIETPNHIPGHVVTEGDPSDLDCHLAYNLNYPEGKGKLRIATGKRSVIDDDTGEAEAKEHIIIEQEVVSTGASVPSLQDESEFRTWLDKAHDVSHEWFFSLIDGELLQQYEKKGNKK